MYRKKNACDDDGVYCGNNSGNDNGDDDNSRCDGNEGDDDDDDGDKVLM